MKILVIGRKEQVGADLCQILTRRQIAFSTITLVSPYLLKNDFIDRVIDETRPTLVVHMSAIFFNDYYEPRKKRYAHLKEYDITHLLRICQQKNIIFFHLSSAKVFSGTHDTPYTEAEASDAIDYVGKKIINIEQNIRSICMKHIILRISWLIHYREHNRLTNIVNCIKHGKVIHAHERSVGNPTSAQDIARIILAIIQQVHCNTDLWGTYHYGSEGIVTDVYLVEAIRSEMAKAKPDHSWVSIYSDKKIKTNSYSCLDCSLIRNTFGIHRLSWRDNLTILVPIYLKIMSIKEK